MQQYTVITWNKSGSSFSSPSFAEKGVPQGDPCSPLLLNLFFADLPDCLPHIPGIPYNQYEDDLVLLAESSEELHCSIDALGFYCDDKGMNINTDKTKCLIFHKGHLPFLSMTQL